MDSKRANTYISLTSLDQNVSIIFVNKIYIGNIWIVWHRKLFMKTLYQNQNLCKFWQFFPCDFLGPKCANTPKPTIPRGLYTTDLNGFKNKIYRSSCRFFLHKLLACFNLFVLFLLTSCLTVAIEPCMEWIPIKNKNFIHCQGLFQ